MFASLHARTLLTNSLVTLVLVIGGAAAAQAATVSFNPETSTAGVGSTVSLNLVGTDFNSGSLDGGGINFTFDASVVEVTSVTVDTSIWEFFSSNGTIDNVAGTVNDIQFNSFQSRTGDLLFATVDFLVIGTGFSPLGLSEFLGNPFATGGQVYPGVVFSQDASISNVPVPGAVWLFGSALGLVGWLRRRA